MNASSTIRPSPKSKRLKTERGQVAKARKIEPDVVICDHHMPASDGLHFIKKVRSGTNGIRRELAIIMLTGDQDEAVFRSAIALDVDAFMSKPSSKEALTKKIQRCFESPQTAEDPDKYSFVKLSGAADLCSQAQFDPASMVKKTIDQIKISKILACDLMSKDGFLLLTAGRKITNCVLARTQGLAKMGSINDVAIFK